MKLVLIRHTSVDVPKGTCYGQTDVPLAKTFPDEAEKVKTELAKYKFDAVYCSPLSRCVVLAKYCGFPDAIRDSRLLEMNFGKWEMKRFDEIHDPQLQKWFDDYINTPAADGESCRQQCDRFLDFISDLKSSFGKDESIAIFTHGGILIHALVAFEGKTYDEVFSHIPPYGTIKELDI